MNHTPFTKSSVKLATEYQSDYDTLKLTNNTTFSNHHLTKHQYIDVKLLVKVLNVLRLLKYEPKYDVVNTKCKTTPVNPSVINFYIKRGVCTKPIVVTDNDFCLDGRHRVIYRKQINNTICSAYIVPNEYVEKFIKNY